MRITNASWLAACSTVAVLLSGTARADTAMPTGERPCAANEGVPVCTRPATGKNTSLRALRLQDAVQNGDLTRDEARKLMPATAASHGYAEYDSSAPAAIRRGGTGLPGHRYWRDQRRRVEPPLPPAE